MLKRITSQIQKIENEKQKELNKQILLQAKIEVKDNELKKLYSFKKEYEKLEKNITEFLNNKK